MSDEYIVISNSEDGDVSVYRRTRAQVLKMLQDGYGPVLTLKDVAEETSEHCGWDFAGRGRRGLMIFHASVFQSPEKRGLTVHLRCLGDSSDGFGLWATALESCSLVREPAPVTPYDHAGDRTRKLAQSIDLLDLSVRTKTRLANAGIRTLGALVTGSSSDILRLPGFGKTSLKEVTQKLAKLGLALADSRTTDGAAAETPTVDWLDTDLSVDTLDASLRVRKVLKAAKVTTIGQLLEKTSAWLLKQGHCGPTTLAEIEQRLAERGLALADA